MKKILTVPVLCLVLVLTGCFYAPDSVNTDPAPDGGVYKSMGGDFLRAAWVPTVWNISFPESPTTSSARLKTEIDTIVKNAADAGLNALFFQARPAADAMYKSKLFPWSRYLTGTQGVAPADGFDPLDYIIRRAHAAGLQLHAWINPFRVTAEEGETLSADHPAALVPWLTFNVGGKLYFDPGVFAARDLIVEGVREIAANYDVDGIHFDDYFYPEDINNEDLETFNTRWEGPDNIADWRRANIDKVITQARRAVKEANPDITFGISPSGIWANRSAAIPAGSPTRGFESYSSIYADSRGWVQNRLVDYIAPQIYWYRGQTGSDFATVLDWWRGVCAGTGVRLYVGLAGYKQDVEFTDPAELAAQIAEAQTHTDGFIVFSYEDIAKKNVKSSLA